MESLLGTFFTMLVPFFGKQFHANFDSDVEQLGPPHPGRPQLEELALLPPPQLHLRLCRALLRGLDQLTGSHFRQVKFSHMFLTSSGV